MRRAGIEGPLATCKGFQHGFGIALLSGEKSVLLNVLRDLMGRTDTQTTELYLKAICYEALPGDESLGGIMNVLKNG